ncbi:hypothetical protein QBC38DRAFT_459223 [Podospora fimiseda]|uniref:Secreted protein n=1 Tax=Podospora fimiseda TaxID=252190 RepID=A0AAN7GXP9_9PEZI|nr:hypothetical protein QBC38DRAFT_459223 [Podospora fimiseda]
MKFTIATALLSGTALANPLSTRQATMSTFTREVTNVRGEGCPNPASLIVDFPSDKSVVVTLRNQIASIGRGVSEEDRERDCTFTLRVRTPAGAHTVNAVSQIIGGFTQATNTGAEGYIWRNHVYDGASLTRETKYTSFGGTQGIIETDNVRVSTNLNTEQVIDYTFSSRVRLQRTFDQNAEANITQSVYTLSLADQS